MKKEATTITLIFLIFLACMNIWMVIFDAQPFIINALNIFFHEAGHWIFSFFGRYIMVLGGTLGELLMPMVFVLYFLKNRNIPGQVFGWWWFSTALYDVSIYVADARARILPLIGGQGGHDWTYLLGKIGILNYDILISRLFIITFLCVTMYMVILIHRYYVQQKNLIIDFN